MFRNAEYRLGLSQSLSKGMLGPAEDESRLPKVSGEIQVKMGDQEIKVVMSHILGLHPFVATTYWCRVLLARPFNPKP